MKVLLIEDDPWLSDLYGDVLSDAGLQVRTATDAQHALDVLDVYTPQVIALDLLLPGANGLALLHELRSYPDLARIPVVINSSVNPAQCGIESASWRAYGVVAYVDKLAGSPLELLRAVRRVMPA